MRNASVITTSRHSRSIIAGTAPATENRAEKSTTWVQARGYLDAISAVRSVDGLDSAPVAVWGDSLSGRVVLDLAALDDRISALVVQVPALGDVIDSDAGEAQVDAIRKFLDAGNFRRPEESWTSAPVVSTDQASSPSALEPLTAFRWFIEYGARFGTGWTNRVTFTTPKDAPLFDPFVLAAEVQVPTQFVVARNDEMPGASSEIALAVTGRLAGSVELLEVEGGHFGLLEYPSESFDQASAAQTTYPCRVLRAH